MDTQTITKTLNEILGQVAGQSGSRAKTAGPFDPSADFATLGVNSVDLMEFILRVEKEFRIDVLSDMLPDDLPTNLNGWAGLVQARLERAARST